jgi:hypothetical protein
MHIPDLVVEFSREVSGLVHRNFTNIPWKHDRRYMPLKDIQESVGGNTLCCSHRG